MDSVDTTSPDLTKEDFDALASQDMSPEEILQLDCTTGHARACTKYGLAALKGSETLKRDDVAGRKYLEFGCSRGDPTGCWGLALTQYNGRGGPADPAEARVSFKKACDGGEAKGCAGLAQMLRKGAGGAVDLEAAKTYFTKACDLGDKPACKAAGQTAP